MTQWYEPQLLELLPPYQSHSTTSLAAAKEIARYTPTMREKVHRCLMEAPGTDEDIAERLGLPQNSLRPRRIELQRSGKVRPLRKVRTRSGRLAWLWGVADGAT